MVYLSLVGSIIGFANLRNVGMHLAALKKIKTKGESDLLTLATSMLVLVVERAV